MADRPRQTALNWLMMAIFCILLLWGLKLYGEVFRAHRSFFLFLWFFLPIVALWLNTDFVSGGASPAALARARLALTCAVAAISFACFAHGDDLRDSVGEAFVAGYHVSYYYEEVDENGPYRETSISTDHWYSQLGMWLVDWSILGLCIGLPVMTWFAASRAVDRRTHDTAT